MHALNFYGNKHITCELISSQRLLKYNLYIIPWAQLKNNNLVIYAPRNKKKNIIETLWIGIETKRKCMKHMHALLLVWQASLLFCFYFSGSIYSSFSAMTWTRCKANFLIQFIDFFFIYFEFHLKPKKILFLFTLLCWIEIIKFKHKNTVASCIWSENE